MDFPPASAFELKAGIKGVNHSFIYFNWCVCVCPGEFYVHHVLARAYGDQKRGSDPLEQALQVFTDGMADPSFQLLNYKYLN